MMRLKKFLLNHPQYSLQTQTVISMVSLKPVIIYLSHSTTHGTIAICRAKTDAQRDGHHTCKSKVFRPPFPPASPVGQPKPSATFAKALLQPGVDQLGFSTPVVMRISRDMLVSTLPLSRVQKASFRVPTGNRLSVTSTAPSPITSTSNPTFVPRDLPLLSRRFLARSAMSYVPTPSTILASAIASLSISSPASYSCSFLKRKRSGCFTSSPPCIYQERMS